MVVSWRHNFPPSLLSKERKMAKIKQYTKHEAIRFLFSINKNNSMQKAHYDEYKNTQEKKDLENELLIFAATNSSLTNV